MPTIPRELIDADADKILRRLRRNGHAAFLVGGCVRDLLVGRKPKDFDVATSATPPEIKDLFRNCRIIGRRFRLAHIFFGQKIIETSTFRSNPREGMEIEEDAELLIRRDNVFGTAEEDARRRDFTINGLFYDIEAAEVIDYVSGLPDLQARLVRTIGDPDIRFREDPVRILRAIKFAARLHFDVEPATYAAMLTHRGEIPKCAPPRVLEEIYRLLRGGAARRSMELLLETGVAETLAPELAWMYGTHAEPATPETAPPPGEASEARRNPLDEAELSPSRARAWRVLDELDALDARPPGDDPREAAVTTNALLLCVLVAPFLPELLTPEEETRKEKGRDQVVMIEEVLLPLVQRLHASRRDAERARQILLALRRLTPGKRRRGRPMALVRRDYFGEALTLYELLMRVDGKLSEETTRWRALWRTALREPQQHGHDSQHAPFDGPPAADAGGGSAPADEPAHDGEPRKRRRRRRGGRRRRRPGEVPAGVMFDGQPAKPDEGEPAPGRAAAGREGGPGGDAE